MWASSRSNPAPDRCGHRSRVELSKASWWSRQRAMTQSGCSQPRPSALGARCAGSHGSCWQTAQTWPATLRLCAGDAAKPRPCLSVDRTVPSRSTLLGLTEARGVFALEWCRTLHDDPSGLGEGCALSVSALLGRRHLDGFMPLRRPSLPCRVTLVAPVVPAEALCAAGEQFDVRAGRDLLDTRGSPTRPSKASGSHRSWPRGTAANPSPPSRERAARRSNVIGSRQLASARAAPPRARACARSRGCARAHAKERLRADAVQQFLKLETCGLMMGRALNRLGRDG
jgi:hypothetical protein